MDKISAKLNKLTKPYIHILERICGIIFFMFSLSAVIYLVSTGLPIHPQSAWHDIFSINWTSVFQFSFNAFTAICIIYIFALVPFIPRCSKEQFFRYSKRLGTLALSLWISLVFLASMDKKIFFALSSLLSTVALLNPLLNSKNFNNQHDDNHDSK